MGEKQREALECAFNEGKEQKRRRRRRSGAQTLSSILFYILEQKEKQIPFVVTQASGGISRICWHPSGTNQV